MCWLYRFQTFVDISLLLFSSTVLSFFWILIFLYFMKKPRICAFKPHFTSPCFPVSFPYLILKWHQKATTDLQAISSRCWKQFNHSLLSRKEKKTQKVGQGSYSISGQGVIVIVTVSKLSFPQLWTFSPFSSFSSRVPDPLWLLEPLNPAAPCESWCSLFHLAQCLPSWASSQTKLIQWPFTGPSLPLLYFL